MMEDFIWLKINDSWGYTAMSRGYTMKDIDKHISIEEIDELLGEGSDDKISELNRSNYLTEETVEFMKSIGWVEKDDFWLSNGDVHAHCFRRI